MVPHSLESSMPDESVQAEELNNRRREARITDRHGYTYELCECRDGGTVTVQQGQALSLNRSAHGNSFIGVHIFARLTTKKLFYFFLHLRHTSHTAHENDVVDVAGDGRGRGGAAFGVRGGGAGEGGGRGAVGDGIGLRGAEFVTHFPVPFRRGRGGLLPEPDQDVQHLAAAP